MFTVYETTDLTVEGDFVFLYMMSYVNYPAVAAEMQLTVKIVNPCADPEALVAPLDL